MPRKVHEIEFEPHDKFHNLVEIAAEILSWKLVYVGIYLNPLLPSPSYDQRLGHESKKRETRIKRDSDLHPKPA